MESNEFYMILCSLTLILMLVGTILTDIFAVDSVLVLLKNDAGQAQALSDRFAMDSVLILFTSCGTVNQPKFKNNNNHKELILSKYGESTIIKNDDNYETWVYDYGSFLKSNRKVIFNKENIIVSNKKTLSPTT